MTPLTEKIAELKRLEQAATAGPWSTHTEHVTVLLFGPNDDNTGMAFDNGADPVFIAAARNLLPDLLKRIEELERDNFIMRAEIDAVTEAQMRRMHAVNEENNNAI